MLSKKDSKTLPTPLIAVIFLVTIWLVFSFIIPVGINIGKERIGSRPVRASDNASGYAYRTDTFCLYLVGFHVRKWPEYVFHTEEKLSSFSCDIIVFDPIDDPERNLIAQ